MALLGEELCPSRDGRVRYGRSKLRFRGPQKPLGGAFVACLGGTETFGQNVVRPYPDKLEERIGMTCVNFGLPNAGVDVFAQDAALLECANRAVLCVLQVPGATNLGNMYYRVHPRRNDRLLEPTEALRALFPEVDFTEFHFTRHLLCHLHNRCETRFGYVRKELAIVWEAQMTALLKLIETPVVLLWLARRRPDEGEGQPTLSEEPSLVSREMLEAVQAHASALVVPDQSGATLHVVDATGLREDGRRISDLLPDEGAHAAAAFALATAFDRLLGS